MFQPHTRAFARSNAAACVALWIRLLVVSLIAVLAAGMVRAQPAISPTELTDLTLRTGQRLSLPAGQWQVLSVYTSTSADVTWTNTAVRNQDPNASVIMLLVREAAPQQRWAQPACMIDGDNTFLVNWHDTRSNAHLSKCSRLRIVGASLSSFRTQADELPGWSRALSLLPPGGPLEAEDVLLAESTVLDQNGGGLRIDALLRAEALGTSSGSLMVREQAGVKDGSLGLMDQWLTQLTEASTGAWLVSPAVRPLSLDALLPNDPGTRLGERKLAQAVEGDAALPDVVKRREWRLPAQFAAGELTYISKGTGAMAATALLLRRDTDLLTPSEGDLLFAGRVDTWASVLVVRHDERLYSVLTSTLPLSLATGVHSGKRLNVGEVMVRGTGAILGRPSLWQQLTWHLVASADDEVLALNAGGGQAISAVRKLLQAPQIDTQLVLGRGAFHLELGPSMSMEGVAFRVNGESWPAADSVIVALLLPEGRHTLEITSGRLFKSTERREFEIQKTGTSVQFADHRGRDLGLVFTPNDLYSTQEARALLDASTQTATAVVGGTASTLAAAPVQAAPPEPLLASPAPPASLVTVSTPAPVPVPVAAPMPTQDTQLQQELERLRAQLALAQSTPAGPAANASALRPMPPNPRRKALVIGNNAYEHVARLDNAQTDALAIAEALQTMGFQVTLGRDLSERRMKELLRNFRQTVQGGDEVVVYFAGHGVQLANTNYLLPVDIRGQNEEEVKDESIPLQRVLDDMQERRAGFMLAIIDACRDNPFRTTTRSANSRGLAPTSAATGQMIIFSAGTGQQALDKLGNNDTDRNGLFTRLLLREIKKPGQPIDRIVRSVRTEVARLARTVGHEQTPAVYDQTLGDFYFIPVATNSR